MKKKYIFFRGVFDTLDLYTMEFVRICQSREIECLILETSKMEDEMLRLKAFLLQPVTAVISFNNIGMHLELESGENIWDYFQIPFYNILMDHPFHYKKALDKAPEQTILLCMDENHMSFSRRFYPHIKQVKFFPHAGIELCKKGQRYLQIKERKIDVLYAGSLSRHAAESLIPDLGAIHDFDAFALVQEALERLIREPEHTTEAMIEQCLKERGIVYGERQLGEIIFQLRFLDAFAVSYYREQIIRNLVEHGVTVTVFGNGWADCEWANHPNFIYGGEVPPHQILNLMCQSKIVLNTMTWFKRGAHDRVFNGMLAGAAVMSDTSSYMEQQFQNGKEVQLFSLQDFEHLNETAIELLQNPKQIQELADYGYQAAKRDHTWENRLTELELI